MVKLSEILLWVFIAIVTTSCNNIHDKSIGQITNKQYDLNSEFRDSITSAWNMMLVKDSIKGKISGITLIENIDSKTKQIYYSILGETTSDSAKVACLAILKNDKFYLQESEVNTVVICFGSKKCTPKMHNQKWVCDDGTGKESCSRDCMKKTVSTLMFTD